MRPVLVCLAFLVLTWSYGLDAGRVPSQEAHGTQAMVPAGWTIDETMRVRQVSHVRISPDRRRVLFAVRTARLTGDKGDYFFRLRVADVDGGNDRALTPDDASTTSGEWSPDARWIAYLADRSGASRGATIWLMPAAGGTPRAIDVGGTGAANLRWAPDGRSLAFTMPAAPTPDQADAEQHSGAPRVMDADVRRNRLWVVGIGENGTARGAARALSPETVSVIGDPDFGHPFDWSPDGRAIAYAHAASPDWRGTWPTAGIASVEVATGQVRPLVAGRAMVPSYAPDGQRIAFIQGNSGFVLHDLDVMVTGVAGGVPRKLAPTFDRYPTIVGWNADGTRVIVSEGRRTVTRLTALPLSGEAGIDIDPGDAVLAGVSLDASRSMVGFTRETMTTPIEAHVTRLEGFRPVRVSRANADLPAHPLPRTEVVRWTSADGAEIEGLLTYPMSYQSGRRYPLVVAVRSGSVVFQQTFVPNALQGTWNDYYPVTEFARRGYLVLQANSRGGLLPGYGPSYAMPVFKVKEKAAGDVLRGVDHLVQQGLADADRLGITGFSNGGLVVTWLLTETTRFKAAVVAAGVGDLLARGFMNALTVHDLGAEPWVNAASYLDNSPYPRLGRLRTPTLILHGESDAAVPLVQSIGLYRSLQRLGVPTSMVVYPGEPHEVSAPKHLMDIGRRHVEWMGRYLEPAR